MNEAGHQGVAAAGTADAGFSCDAGARSLPFASEEYSRDLLEALPVAIYTTDAAGRITFYNRAAAELAGREPILGTDRWCVTWRLYNRDGSPLPHEQCPMAVALKENRPVRGAEAIAERPDGTRVAFMPYPTPLRDAAGRLIGAVNLLVDITDRKRIEEELRRFSERLEEKVAERTKELSDVVTQLRQSERRFRLLVESVTDYAIFMLDPDGFITNWNAGAERIKGYSGSEIIGKHFSVFYPEEDRKAGRPDRALLGARHTGRFEGEGWRLRKDGTRFWANAIIDAIHDESGALIGFAKVTRDLTERREMEEQLRHALKMEAIGQLTGGVAHDFNNLLTAVMANIDFISAEAEKPSQIYEDRVKRHAEAAMRAANRGAMLTHQLLAFARKQTLAPKPTSLNDLVTGMSDMLRRTLGGTVRVELGLANGLWATLVDPNQIESALLNLAINARDAMPDGGVLFIETANRRMGFMNHRQGLEPGDYVVVAVTDTGSGMTEEIRAKAFDPFFTTKDVGKGSGLGLSQVYGIARQSGGIAEIESVVGRGTTVRIYLPRARQAADSSRSPGKVSATHPDLSGVCVLVVDDDDSVRDVVVEALGEAGCAVNAVSSGRAALEALRADRFDLAVIDFAMPGLNGADTAVLVRAQRPDLPILFITGRADLPVLQSVGNSAVLQKPFVASDLFAKLRSVLQRSASMPGNVVPLRRGAG
jgi:PAS domain S-box-containing protein